MKKFALSALALVFVMSAAAGAMAQTIDEIQAYDPVTGLPASPHHGSLVTVEGVVYVQNNVYNNGTHYILDDTGNGINFYAPSLTPAGNVGDRIQVTGTVTNFGGEINLGSPSVAYVASEAEPTPVVMAVEDVLNGVGGEDGYENVGKFVEVAGIIATVGGNNFEITNATNSDTLYVYIDSTTGINLGAGAVGDAYRVISPVNVYNGSIQLKPRKQGDLIEGSGPVIDAINCDDWSPLASESIVVSAEIVDDVSVATATLYYRDSDGSGTGAFTAVAMTNTMGDIYAGTIPPGTLGRQVDFYVEATDGEANLSANPGDAPASWYEVAVGMTPIYDIQYVHPDSLFTGSNLFGQVVNVNGIVTVGTGDAGLSQSQFVIQDADGAWNGLFIYEGSAGNFLLAGDEVEIGGTVTEYYGLTEVNPHNASAVELVSFENALPTPVMVNTAVLSDDETIDVDGTPARGEPYESVWVKTFNSTVIDTTGSAAYSTFEISDTGAQADSLIVDAGFNMVYTPVIGDQVVVTGFINYDYGNFELVPVSDEGIVVLGNAVGDTPVAAPAGGFSSIAPNPFNPQTEIKFVLTRDNLTQLNVYNLRGELVNSLVNARLQGGQEYVMTWDGRDGSGQQVSSGTYFARLRIGTEVLQVRKLMLVK